ncbi:hypothetical protein SAMN05444157_1636 [Frankineae bacterium MT45]|nr:hypothetical protein SAMN05444157_1636 [Frankineae bacterium MT45]
MSELTNEITVVEASLVKRQPAVIYSASAGLLLAALTFLAERKVIRADQVVPLQQFLLPSVILVVTTATGFLIRRVVRPIIKDIEKFDADHGGIIGDALAVAVPVIETPNVSPDVQAQIDQINALVAALPAPPVAPPAIPPVVAEA